MDSQAELENTCLAPQNRRHPCLFPARALRQGLMQWDKGGLGQRRELAKGRDCLNSVSRHQSGAAWDFSRVLQGHVSAGESQAPALVSLQVLGIPSPFAGEQNFDPWSRDVKLGGRNRFGVLSSKRSPSNPLECSV